MGFPDKCQSPKNLTIDGKAGPGGEEKGGGEGGKGAKKDTKERRASEGEESTAGTGVE
jgi:hypothetical protein